MPGPIKRTCQPVPFSSPPWHCGSRALRSTPTHDLLPNRCDRSEPNQSVVVSRTSSFNGGVGVSDDFLRGKVAQETNAARKTAEEAAEIAARAEHELAESVSTAADSVKKLAEANRTNAEADKTKQEAFALMLDNLDRIAKLPESMQAAAMDRLMASSPALSQQVETIQSLLEKLHVRHGLTLLAAPAEEPVATEDAG